MAARGGAAPAGPAQAETRLSQARSCAFFLPTFFLSSVLLRVNLDGGLADRGGGSTAAPAMAPLRSEESTPASRGPSDHDKAISKAEFARAMRTLSFSGEDIDEAWAIFDADGSNQVVYHELLAVLQPSVAAANPSKQAMDPTNQRHAFTYNRHDQEAATGLIARDEGVRDVPYEEMERIRKQQRNPRFRD